RGAAALPGSPRPCPRPTPHASPTPCAPLRDPAPSSALPAIAAPTLVIAGDADLAAPVELVRNCTAIPGSRLEILAGVGHIPSLEQPEMLSGLISDFLKEVGHG